MAPSQIDKLLADLSKRVGRAVNAFWKTRTAQANRQQVAGRSDAGARCAVTGGAQMDGFISLYSDLLSAVGIDEICICCKQRLELPGYYRSTKEWDMLVVANGQLLAAIEVKSQVGPSFGNNFNNRAEEAIGSACDLWTAYREGAFDKGIRPWLGYIFLLDDCAQSQRPVSVKEPHFQVFPEFKDASYAKRYEILCRKLVRERLYDRAAFLTSDAQSKSYTEPAEDLTMDGFARSLLGHIIAHKGAG